MDTERVLALGRFSGGTTGDGFTVPSVPGWAWKEGTMETSTLDVYFSIVVLNLTEVGKSFQTPISIDVSRRALRAGTFCLYLSYCQSHDAGCVAASLYMPFG